MIKIINYILIILILNISNAEIVKNSNNLLDYLEKLNLNRIKLDEDISVSTLNDEILLNTSSKDVLITTPSKQYLLSNFSKLSLVLNNNNENSDDNTQLKDKLLVPNSKKFDEWFHVKNLKLNTDFYLFNVTNPDEILKGEKPILKELGPFSYAKKKWYENPFWEDNENFVNVRMFKSYKYVGDLNLNDKITTVNIPLHFIFNLINSKGPFELNEDTKKGLYKIFKEFPLFVNHKIGDLLFNGYQDDLTANFLTYERRVRLFLKDFEPKLYKVMKNGRFSLMGNKNNSNYGLWTINTGKSNLDRIGQLYKLDGNTTNACWFDSCSIVNGTDGLINTPYIDKNNSLTIFIPEHYRSFRLNRIEISDDFKKFKMSKHSFDTGESYSPNKCYLKKDRNEKNDKFYDYNGVLKDCALTSLPITSSNPHFLFGDKFFANQMIGLKENEEEHDSYIKFSTRTWKIENGRINSQINFDTKSISKARNLTRFIFPVFWSSELFERID